MMGLMMFVARNPEISAKLGLVGTKATLFGQNDWAGYFGLFNQMGAAIGYVGFGFVASWVFGREYIDRTAKDLLSLPVPRSSIVFSKFLVVIIWSVLLMLVMFAVGILTGQLVGIPGWSGELFTGFAGKFLITFLLTLLLVPPVAFLASYGRGIIAPIGFVILSLILAQFAGLVGMGPYFPWAIPGVNTAPSGTDGMTLVAASYIILGFTGLAGLAGTLAWWRYADQH